MASTDRELQGRAAPELAVLVLAAVPVAASRNASRPFRGGPRVLNETRIETSSAPGLGSRGNSAAETIVEVKAASEPLGNYVAVVQQPVG